MNEAEVFDYGQSYEKMRSRAAAGDGAAAFKMFQAIAACRNIPRDEGAFQKVIDRILEARSIEPGTPDAYIQDEGLQRRILDLRKRYPFCSTIPKEDKETELEWLMAAAKAGVTDAQLLFVLRPESLARDAPQQFKDSRTKFLGAVDVAALGGNQNALERLWEFYFSGDKGLPQDGVKAYAYLMASVDINSASKPGFREGYEQYAADPNMYYRQLRDQLSPYELEQAERLRADIVKASGMQ